MRRRRLSRRCRPITPRKMLPYDTRPAGAEFPEGTNTGGFSILAFRLRRRPRKGPASRSWAVPRSAHTKVGRFLPQRTEQTVGLAALRSRIWPGRSSFRSPGTREIKSNLQGQRQKLNFGEASSSRLTKGSPRLAGPLSAPAHALWSNLGSTNESSEDNAAAVARARNPRHVPRTSAAGPIIEVTLRAAWDESRSRHDVGGPSTVSLLP